MLLPGVGPAIGEFPQQEIDERPHLWLGEPATGIDRLQRNFFAFEVGHCIHDQPPPHCVRVEKAGQIRNAKARDGSRQQRLPIIDGQRARGTHLMLGVVGASQGPDMAAGPDRAVQKLVPA